MQMKKSTKTILFILMIIILIILTIFISKSIMIDYYNNHFSRISKNIIDSVIIIEVKTPNGFSFDCTGFIVDKKGYAITAYHCFGDHLAEYNNYTKKSNTVKGFVEETGIVFVPPIHDIPDIIKNLEKS